VLGGATAWPLAPSIAAYLDGTRLRDDPSGRCFCRWRASLGRPLTRMPMDQTDAHACSAAARDHQALQHRAPIFARIVETANHQSVVSNRWVAADRRRKHVQWLGLPRRLEMVS